MNDFSEQFVAIALAATWCGFGLYGILRKIERSPQAREMLRRFKQARLSTKAAVVAGLIAVVAVGGNCDGSGPAREIIETEYGNILLTHASPCLATRNE